DTLDVEATWLDEPSRRLRHDGTSLVRTSVALPVTHDLFARQVMLGPEGDLPAFLTLPDRDFGSEPDLDSLTAQGNLSGQNRLALLAQLQVGTEQVSYPALLFGSGVVASVLVSVCQGETGYLIQGRGFDGTQHVRQVSTHR